MEQRPDLLADREFYHMLSQQFKRKPVDTHAVIDYLSGLSTFAMEYGYVPEDPVAFRSSVQQWANDVAMAYKAWRERPPSPKAPSRSAKPIDPQMEQLKETIADTEQFSGHHPRKRYIKCGEHVIQTDKAVQTCNACGNSSQQYRN